MGGIAAGIKDGHGGRPVVAQLPVTGQQLLGADLLPAQSQGREAIPVQQNPAIEITVQESLPERPGRQDRTWTPPKWSRS